MSGTKSQNDDVHGAQSRYRDTNLSPQVVEGSLKKVDQKLCGSVTDECQEVDDGIAGSKSKGSGGTAKYEAKRYNINEANRGTCVIIKNNGSSDKPEAFDDDAKLIAKTFTDLGFKIECLDDLDSRTINNKLVGLRQNDHVCKRDCLCIFVLAWSSSNDSLWATDFPWNTLDIWTPFTAEKCEGLAGKPKLFFVQASVSSVSRPVSPEEPETEPMVVEEYIPVPPGWSKIASNADLMAVHYENGLIIPSDGNNKERASYVTILCELLDKYAGSMDILEISTITARRIYDAQSSEYKKVKKGTVFNECLPITTSTLRKQLYFQSTTNNDDLKGKNIHQLREEYSMSFGHTPTCVVFNHLNFDDKRIKPRRGTEIDVHKIEATFTDLGFGFDVHHDKSEIEIKAEIQRLSQLNYKYTSCLCIFVLTHGFKGDLLMARDKPYPLSVIWKPFVAVESLKGKPKLFFIQACRGPLIPVPVLVEDPSAESNEVQDAVMNSCEVPDNADFLIAHSTLHDYLSVRTWFVQTLCNVLRNCSDSVDLLGMLTITTRYNANEETKIALTHEDDPRIPPGETRIVYVKQSSSITSTLTKAVYLRKQTPK